MKKQHINNERIAEESLDKIIKRIGPYMPKKPIVSQDTKEQRWSLIESDVCPPLFPAEPNQTVSPF
ncbi:MAG: hypothetical protein ABSG82_09655 [Sedimentisphaerales bacterium]|jgi:hypothetical protein